MLLILVLQYLSGSRHWSLSGGPRCVLSNLEVISLFSALLCSVLVMQVHLFIYSMALNAIYKPYQKD